MKRREVILSPEARADLLWIYDAIADAASPVTAAGYIDRLEVFCNKLALGSQRGSLHDDIRAGLRIVGFERRVTVAFTVEDDRVVILRLFYGGANWEEAL